LLRPNRWRGGRNELAGIRIVNAMIHRIVSRPVVRWVLVVSVAFLCGWAAGRTEAPDDASVFWIGNLAAPYLVIGFVAGAWVARKAAAAAAAGALSVVAAVAGFYDILRIVTVTNLDEGLAPDVPRWSAVLQSLGRWLSLMLWGNTPWLMIGVVVGLVTGLLGYRWRVRGGRLEAFAVGAALVVEPVVYLGKLNARVPGLGAAYAASVHNVVIWGGEVLLGVVVVVAAARVSWHGVDLSAADPKQPVAQETALEAQVVR
jgi:hypothetical protein